MIFAGMFSKRESGAGVGCAEISHDEFAATARAGTLHVIDVREPNEYAGEHVPGAVNCSLSRFDPWKLPSGIPWS